jgi:hypothetical protein
MLKLEDVRKNAAVTGIEPNLVVRVVTTKPVGPKALTVYHRTVHGRLRECMFFRTEEETE